MKWALLALMLALAGCAGQPVAEPEPRVVRVDVPVQVPCKVHPVATPAWAAAGLKATDSLEVKVRAGANADLSDAAAWAAVPLAESGVAPVLNGRYAQVQVCMAPGTNALTTPEVQDFTIRWSGGRRYADLSGIFSTGPDHGIYELLVNGAPLLQGVTVQVSVFKEIQLGGGGTSRMVSSAFAEIVPRN